VVDARRHNHKITLLEPQAHPVVVLAPNIEVSSTSQNVADLLVLVQVLVEEGLHLLLVAGEQLGRNLNLVAVLVVALGSDLVDAVQVVGEVVVCYAESGKVFWVHWASRVMREALVALLRLVLVNREIALLGWRGYMYRQVVEPVGFHFDVYMALR
jgi:hypothetical protein